MADPDAFDEICGDPAVIFWNASTDREASRARLEDFIGWHFAKASQGRGYATEAAAGLLAHAKQHGVEAVYAKILPDQRRLARCCPPARKADHR